MKLLQIGSFQIVKDINGNCFDTEVRSLHSGHIDEIYKLQTKVMDNLKNKENYQFQSQEEINYIISESKAGLGMWVNNQLIGFCYGFVPMHNKNNIGLERYLPLEQRLKVGHIERCVVDAGFRENGIQTFLTQQVVYEIFKNYTTSKGEKLRYIYCKVHPLNEPMLRGLIKSGLKIVDLKKNNDGIMQYTLSLDFENPWDKSDFVVKIETKPDNYEYQVEIFDYGYKGVNYRVRDGELFIQYGFQTKKEKG